MKHWCLFAVLAAFPAILSAQSETSTSQPPQYEPAVPAPSYVNAYGGGWFGHTGGGTAAGSALNGMASVIGAKGDYNLSTSAAAVNMTQAQRNEIQNRQQWTNTYFDMRQTNRQARAAERSPTPTMEQLARQARLDAPKSLSPGEMDPTTGQIAWPSALQQPSFASQRTAVDHSFAARARYGGLDYAEQMKVRETIESMSDQLKEQIRQIPPQDYVACRTFLRSLLYAATKTDL